MSLPQGAKLGPYEVVGAVGSGGMGEVYKARDTRLGRSVAVKILPSIPRSAEATRQRFESEARAISQLSHANVCALYDIGDQDGLPFLVMELLEGETLAERLKKGALPLIKPPQIGGGTFSAAFWSPDGRFLAGGISPAHGGVRGNALYDIEKRVARQLSEDAIGYEMAWMPGHKSVLYFTASGALVFQDIASLKREEIAVTLPYPPDAYRSLTASPDGRTLYYGAQQVEGNIWKVEPPQPR